MTHEPSWGQLADELEGLKAVVPLRAQWHAYVGSENYGIWILRPDGQGSEQVRATFTLDAAKIIEKLGIPPIPVPQSLQHCPHWIESCAAEEDLARQADQVLDLSDAVPYGLDMIDRDAVDPCTRAFLEVLRREGRPFRIKSNGAERIRGKTYNAGITTSFSWDSRNRLQSMTTNTGQTTTFTYDFAGNLLIQADAGPALNLTRSFVLDDLTNVAFQMATDGTSYTILSGQAIDSHLAIVQSTGQVQYGLTDGINSTVATVDQLGAIQSRFAYEPLGQTTATGTYPFQFTGRVPVTGSMYYYRARFYNAVTGRFISEDPLRSGNLYTYANNNPIIFNDPLGLASSDSWFERYIDTFPLKGNQPERYQAGLDLRHYTAAQNVANLFGQIPGLPFPEVESVIAANLLGLGVEISQVLQHMPSGFDPQDFLSNFVGSVSGVTGIDPFSVDSTRRVCR